MRRSRCSRPGLHGDDNGRHRRGARCARPEPLQARGVEARHVEPADGRHHGPTPARPRSGGRDQRRSRPAAPSSGRGACALPLATGREVAVGNRELASLSPEMSFEVKQMRRAWRALVPRPHHPGCRDRRVRGPLAELMAYTMLDMGIGLSLWFRDDGEFSADQVAYHYADLAMRVVGR
ncbi:MAG: hypothetical protein R2710_20780 [Acidimicrobiales bacterium]